MSNAFERARRLIGEQRQRLLEEKRVAVFGLGGVGSYAAEALMRAGIGQLTLVDGDSVDETNINRQLYATCETIGQPKALVAARRAHAINPSARIDARVLFYDENTMDQLDFRDYDYIVDAIDSVRSKILLIENAAHANTPIISCMGTGNKLYPTRFEVADIYQTSVCPLARIMRRELRARGIERLKVVYSRETPRAEAGSGRTPGSISFVPPVAGLIMAGEVVRALTGLGENEQ